MKKTKRNNGNNRVALNEKERIFLCDSLFEMRSLIRAAKDIHELENEGNMDIYNLMTVAEDKADKIFDFFDEKGIT